MSPIRIAVSVSLVSALLAGVAEAQSPDTIRFDAATGRRALTAAPGGRQSPQGEILYDTLRITDEMLADAGVGNAIGGSAAFPSLGTIDSQFADDFELNGSYRITTIFADYQSYFNGDQPAEGLWVQFYADNGGVPSEDLHADAIITDYTAEYKGMFANRDTFRYELDLSQADIVLDAGRWWVDIQPLDVAEGGWFWALSRLAYDPPQGELSHVRDGWQAHGNNYYGLWRSTVWIPHNFRGNATPARQIRGEPAAARPRMQLSGSCPGSMQLSISGASPNGIIAILIGLQTGSAVIPGGRCEGTVLGLGPQGIRLLGTFRADANGSLILSRNVGTAVCGRFVQGVDGATCQTTNVVEIE